MQQKDFETAQSDILFLYNLLNEARTLAQKNVVNYLEKEKRKFKNTDQNYKNADNKLTKLNSLALRLYSSKKNLNQNDIIEIIYRLLTHINTQSTDQVSQAAQDADNKRYNLLTNLGFSLAYNEYFRKHKKLSKEFKSLKHFYDFYQIGQSVNKIDEQKLQYFTRDQHQLLVQFLVKNLNKISFRIGLKRATKRTFNQLLQACHIREEHKSCLRAFTNIKSLRRLNANLKKHHIEIKDQYVIDLVKLEKKNWWKIRGKKSREESQVLRAIKVAFSAGIGGQTPKSIQDCIHSIISNKDLAMAQSKAYSELEKNGLLSLNSKSEMYWLSHQVVSNIMQSKYPEYAAKALITLNKHESRNLQYVQTHFDHLSDSNTGKALFPIIVDKIVELSEKIALATDKSDFIYNTITDFFKHLAKHSFSQEQVSRFSNLPFNTITNLSSNECCTFLISSFNNPDRFYEFQRNLNQISDGQQRETAPGASLESDNQHDESFGKTVYKEVNPQVEQTAPSTSATLLLAQNQEGAQPNPSVDGAVSSLEAAKQAASRAKARQQQQAKGGGRFVKVVSYGSNYGAQDNQLGRGSKFEQRLRAAMSNHSSTQKSREPTAQERAEAERDGNPFAQ